MKSSMIVFFPLQHLHFPQKTAGVGTDLRAVGNLYAVNAPALFKTEAGVKNVETLQEELVLGGEDKAAGNS